MGFHMKVRGTCSLQKKSAWYLLLCCCRCGWHGCGSTCQGEASGRRQGEGVAPLVGAGRDFLLFHGHSSWQ
jgi:hypothetical protein